MKIRYLTFMVALINISCRANFDSIAVQNPGVADTSTIIEVAETAAVGDFLTISSNPSEESEFISGSILDSQNRLLLWGSVRGLSDDAAIWRVNGDGTLDTSFGTNGRFLWDSPGGLDDQVYTIKENSDGSLLVGGRSRNANNSWEGLIGRLSKDGQADISFSPSGFKIIDLDDTKSRFLRSAKFDSQNRLLITGVANGLSFDVFMARADPQGVVDPSFGTGGYLQWDSSNPPSLATSDKENGLKMVVDSGYIYLTGSSDFSGTGFVMKLTESTGVIEKVTLGLQFKSVDIKLQEDHVYLAGYRLNPTEDSCWARVNKADLSLDPSFGQGGEACHTASSGGARGRASNLSLSSNGEVFIGGFNDANQRDGIVIKSLPDGSADTVWEGAGWISLSDLTSAGSAESVSSTNIVEDFIYTIGMTSISINGATYSRYFIKGSSVSAKGQK